MELYLDTTDQDFMEIGLLINRRTVSRKIYSSRQFQAEKLLPAIKKFLAAHRLSLKKIKKILVKNKGGGFTSLRVGVATANALAFGLGVPVAAWPESNPGEAKAERSVPGKDGRKIISSRRSVNGQKAKQKFSLVVPSYDQAPQITVKKYNH